MTDAGPEAPRRTPFRVIQGGRGLESAPEEATPGTEGPLEPKRIGGLGGPLIALALLTLIRLGIAGLPGLAADEAYYWTWSRALDAGYYDHPPAIAFLVRASTALLGDTELGVRAGAVLLGSLGALALLLVSRRPWLTLAGLVSMPLFLLGGLLATPDVPLLFGWAVAMAAAARGGRWWLLAGAAAGVAVMSKLTGLLLLPLLFLGAPRELRGRWPWLGLGVLVLVALPNWIWLARHDWVTYGFQLSHGLGGTATGLGGLAVFLGGQALIVTPLLALAAALFWAVAWREPGMPRFLWWASFPVLVAFGGAALLSPSEANWAAPAWIAVLPGLGYLAERWRKLAWVGVGMGALACLLLLVHVVHPLVAWSKDPSLRLVGGEVLGQAVQAWGVPRVYTERYQDAAWIRFYGGIQATVLPGAGRTSQFDAWDIPPPDEVSLYVRTWRRGSARRVASLWAQRDGPNSVVARDAVDRIAGRWQVYELRGYRGEAWPPGPFKEPTEQTP